MPSSVLSSGDGCSGLSDQLRRIGLLVCLGWAGSWLATRALDVHIADPGERVPLLLGIAALAAILTLALGLLAVRRPAVVPSAVVAATSVMIVGLATAALHGTRWTFDALYSDAGFRTEAATRFADAPALADYAYRGLPSYYPPALPWIQGRVADLAGMPAWTVMKPVTLVLAAVIPVAAYVMWRRVVPELTAAGIVAFTSLATVDLVKPDEWLVLALVLPWWFELVRDIRAPGRRRLPAWAHGLVLGGLLLVHSFYFFPLGLATIVGLVIDALLRRPMPLRPLRALLVAALGLLCAAPYWLPLLRLAAEGVPADHLQRRWSTVGFAVPPLPLPGNVAGLLGLLCVGWLVLRVRSSRLAESLAVALGTSYVYFVGGQALQRYDIALLPEKAGQLITALLCAGGVLALQDLGAVLRSRHGRRTTCRLAILAAVALAVPASVGHSQHWLLGPPAVAAQHLRYPDGSYPAGGPPDPGTHQHPWAVSPLTTEPSTAQVEAGWVALTGRALDADTVLLTGRGDLLGTTAIHSFIAPKSIYSHPDGQFQQRLALLRRVSGCGSPRCAWQLLRHNRFDAVDGAVLTNTPDGLRLALTTDRFPDAWVITPVNFPPELFRPPYFSRRDVGRVVLVSVHP